MGRKLRSKTTAKSPDKVLPENDDSGFSTISASNSVSSALSQCVIKLKPLSVLLCNDSHSLSTQFAFNESFVSAPVAQTQHTATQVDNTISDVTEAAPLADTSQSDAECHTQTQSKPEIKPDPVFLSPKKVPRKFKKQLIGNYHKVTDFFTVTPRKSLNASSSSSQASPSPSGKENICENNKESDVEKRPSCSQAIPTTTLPSNTQVHQQFTATTSSQPVTRFETRRRLCKSTNLRKVSNRYQSEDQTRMNRFFDATGDDAGEGCSYFTTFKSSQFPVRINGVVDVDLVVSLLDKNEEHLDIQVDQETRSIMIDLKEELDSEPQEKILDDIRRSLQQLLDFCVEEEQLNKKEEDVEVIERMEDDVISISSSISDKDDSQFLPEAVQIVVKKTPVKRGRGRPKSTKAKHPAKPKATPKKRTRQKPVCPSYKIIKDTKLAVDAFRFGEIEGVTNYFLTHFHSDHYVGLKKDFKHPIYMSTVTANLVRKLIKVDEKYLRPMEMNSAVMVDDVEVTALDANHCPGAVMFVFKLPNGNCILHVGDFRASPEMEEESIFWNNHINCVYLDTTYLSSKADHPKQMDAISEMITGVQKYQLENIGEKYLIIVGTYVIGKERVWQSLARELGCRVWLEKSRMEAVECYGDSSMLELLEVDPLKALIHVLPLQNLFYENLVKYLEQFEDVYTRVLAIRPSGWEAKNNRLQKRGPITIMGVQYSEHSSYSELERFVRHLQPDEVISTVPLGSDLMKTPKIPSQWLSKEVEPKRQGQQSITCFLKVKRSSGGSSQKDVNGEGEEGDQEIDDVLDLSTKVHVDTDGVEG